MFVFTVRGDGGRGHVLRGPRSPQTCTGIRSIRSAPENRNSVHLRDGGDGMDITSSIDWLAECFPNITQLPVICPPDKTRSHIPKKCYSRNLPLTTTLRQDNQAAACKRFLYLLRVELPLHHLHEVFVRHREGHVRLPAVRAFLQRAAAVLQVDGCVEAE